MNEMKICIKSLYELIDNLNKRNKLAMERIRHLEKLVHNNTDMIVQMVDIYK
jgi:hypothetical protein